MAVWLQHLLVLTIVAGCLGFVGVQAVRTLRGKKSKLGACCAKGCDAHQSEQQQVPTTSSRVHFLPADALRKRGG